jgi:hypothetical protein
MFGKLLRQSCERLDLPNNTAMKQWHVSVRTPKRSAAAQYSNGISGDRWPIAPSDRAFVDLQVRLGIAAEARRSELEDRRRLRTNGTEAQRAAATRMRMADAASVETDARRHIVQMYPFNIRAVVLMTSPTRIGLFGMVSNNITLADCKGHSQGRGYRPKQICDGEKPSQPSSLRSRQAAHLTTNVLQNIGSVERPANSRASSPTRSENCAPATPSRLPGPDNRFSNLSIFPSLPPWPDARLTGVRRGRWVCVWRRYFKDLARRAAGFVRPVAPVGYGCSGHDFG